MEIPDKFVIVRVTLEEVTELDVTGGFSTDTLDEELRGA